MLPFEKPWYRKLLLLAPLIGMVGGVLAVVFMGLTGTANDLLYAGTGLGWFSGRWWWIPLTALGGLLVAFLRQGWKVPRQVPGTIALAQQGWVEPSTAIYWVLISAVSLVMGASLGPSFGLVVMGGGFGAWLVTRLGKPDLEDEQARQGFALTGMTGGMGGGYSAPLFAPVLASELSPTAKKDYVAMFIPELLAATFGFAIYYGITGSSMLGSYRLPEYQLNFIDLVTGALLGIAAVFVLLLHTGISRLIAAVAARIGNPYLLGAAGGALVGLIAFALPLTATAGSKQLGLELDVYESLGVGLLIAVLLGKMVAISLSQSSGFLGGIVFPAIFLGGTSGLLVHSLFPSIPIALCVGGMLAAVPGAFLNAPLALIIIAAGTVRLQPEALLPIGLAVVVAHVFMSAIRHSQSKAQLPPSN